MNHVGRFLVFDKSSLILLLKELAEFFPLIFVYNGTFSFTISNLINLFYLLLNLEIISLIPGTFNLINSISSMENALIPNIIAT